MKAYITVKVIIDSEKKTVVAKTKTKVDKMEFTGSLSLNSKSTESEVNSFNDRIFEKAQEPLKMYGHIFGS